MASYIDARFRMYPTQGECTETAHFDFNAVMDPSQHAIQRPSGDGRPFYELPTGEVSFFRETDEVYLSFGHEVRALCKAGSGSAVLSTVESEA